MLDNDFVVCFFFFNDTATTEIYTLSLHDALPISSATSVSMPRSPKSPRAALCRMRTEEHTSELQSRRDLVCRLLLEQKKTNHPSKQHFLISATVQRFSISHRIT